MQGNPVYDYDHSDYIGAYAQDELERAAEPHPQCSACAGSRSCRCRTPTGWVSHFDQARFDQNIHSTVYPQAPAGLMFPGDAGYPGISGDEHADGRSSRRASAWSGQPHGDETDERPRGVGRLLRHAAAVLQHPVRQQPAVGRADHDLTNPPGGLTDPWRRLPGRQPVPGAQHRMGDAAVPGRPASTSTRRSTRIRRRCSSGTSRCSTSSATGWSTRELSRQPLEPSVARDRAQLRRSIRPRRDDRRRPTPRRVLELREPGPGAFYGTIGQLDDTGRANYDAHAAVAAAAAARQPERPLQLHALEVHERSGDHRADRTDDRQPGQPESRLLGTARRIAATSSTCRWCVRTPDFENRRRARDLRRLAGVAARAVAEGNRSSVTTGDRQRADRHGQPARGAADARRSLRRQRRSNNYLNIDAAFTSPATGTYSTLAPNAFVRTRAACRTTWR